MSSPSPLSSSSTTPQPKQQPRRSCLKHSTHHSLGKSHEEEQLHPRQRRAIRFDASHNREHVIPADQYPTDAEKARMWYSVQETQAFRALARAIRSGNTTVVVDELVESRRGLEHSRYNYNRRQWYLAYVLNLQAQQRQHQKQQSDGAFSSSSSSSTCSWNGLSWFLTNDPTVALAVMACVQSRGAIETARNRADKDALAALRIHDERSKYIFDRLAFYQAISNNSNYSNAKLVGIKSAVARQA